MKAKSIIQFLTAMAVFAVGVVLPTELIAHFFAPEMGGVVVGMAAVVNFANLDGQSYQEANPGGLRKVYMIASRLITGIWPNKTVITAGEITALPTLVATNKFAVYDFPDGKASVDSDQSGEPGFQSYKHSAELMIAGFSKGLQAEMQKHLNAGTVMVVEMNDGQLVVIGASDNPIFFKKSFKGGKKGNDPRGFTLKGEQDGFMWDLLPLSSTIAATLPVYPVV